MESFTLIRDLPYRGKRRHVGEVLEFNRRDGEALLDAGYVERSQQEPTKPGPRPAPPPTPEPTRPGPTTPNRPQPHEPTRPGPTAPERTPTTPASPRARYQRARKTANG